MEKTYDPARVAAAKAAVNTLWGFRADMADTGTLEVFIGEAREISREARAAGRKISAADWIYLAELANDVCDDDGLPRLFESEPEPEPEPEHAAEPARQAAAFNMGGAA